MKAIWNNQVIAESDDIVKLEGNAYFPESAIDTEFFTPTAHKSTCPWKGVASYYSIKVAGEVNENAAWYYPEPKDAALPIKNRIAFWRGVVVE